MASSSEFTISNDQRKRKKVQTQRKLLVDDHVEVRSEEEGFEGSWHSAVVVACGDGYREVRYERMVDQDGYSAIFDRVEVSPAVEGLSVEFDQLKYRGSVRPVPPVVEFGPYSIPYGSCVDVSYNDAWWEGVVFDNEDGETSRKVFFPDLGDEMDVDILNIRISQEWNEVTEEWRHRGIWYFLEVAEDFESQFFSVCSIKQLWYNVRGKVGFKKLGEWTSSDRVMWKELVAETIDDCTDEYLDQIFSSTDMPSEPTIDNSLTAELTNCSSVVLFDASLRTSGDRSAEHDDFSSEAVGSDLSFHITESIPEETVLVGLDCLRGKDNLNTKMSAESSMFSDEKILSTVPDQNLDANAFTASQRYPCADDSMLNEEPNHSSRKSGLYPPHELNKLPGQRYFPNIIGEYLHAFVGNKKPGPSLTANVRMHLSFCGWRTDQMKDKGGTLRKRYISPDGNPYHSLRQACLNFLEPSEIVSSAQINPEDTDSTPADAISPLILDEPRNIEHKKLPRKRFFPSIIEEYLDAFGGNNKPKQPLTTNVKRHLSYCGWRIEPMKHTDGRPRTRYTSPDGKSYQSLRIACLSLKEHSMEIVSSARINSEDTHFSPVDAISPMRQGEPKEIEDYDYSPMPPLPLNSNIIDVEPEYCPQAVLDYVNIETKKERNCDIRSIRLRAKKHLVATGWKLSHREGEGKPVLHYLSPTNRSYYSLVRACRACIKEGNANMDASAYRPMVCINVNAEDVPSGDSSMKCLSPPPTSFREKLRGRRSSQVSRELVQLDNFKIEKNRNSRTYGTKHKSQLAQSHSSKSGTQADLHASNNRSVIGLVGKYTLRTLDDESSNFHRSKRRKAVSNIPAHSLRYSKIERQMAISSSSLYEPQNELSWLIDNSVVLPKARVYYSGRKDHDPIKEGRIFRNGIKCKCCRNLFSIRGFQSHAGSEYQMPCAHIYLEDGRSLLDCQKQVVVNDIQSYANMSTGLQQGENDSICSICHYGGDLILCDQCPSSFHINCVGLKNVPDGEWFCPSCCCGICGQRKQEGIENIIDDTFIICVQCEHKYHFECLKRAGGFMLDEYPMKGWVCGKKCKKIFLSLHKLLGRRISVGADNLSWTLLKSMAYESPDPDANIEALTENHIKLKVALDVMHECFESVKEPYTGKDLMENVVFSNRSNLNRLNFRGFYTAVLEKNDELVTVANVRIYGEKVAEVPLIGTRFRYRRLGMCRTLMNELEKKLRSIGVERLILPAIPSMLNAWTTSFGFSKMTDSERLQYLSYTFLDFQGTTMCHKILSENPSADIILQTESGPKCEHDVNGNGNNVVVQSNGSSPISEVFQADQAEQFQNNQTVDQGMLDIPESGNCDKRGTVQQLVEVNESTQVEDAVVMETQKKNCIKYYERRKKQHVGVSNMSHLHSLL